MKKINVLILLIVALSCKNVFSSELNNNENTNANINENNIEIREENKKENENNDTPSLLTSSEARQEEEFSAPETAVENVDTMVIDKADLNYIIKIVQTGTTIQNELVTKIIEDLDVINASINKETKSLLNFEDPSFTDLLGELFATHPVKTCMLTSVFFGAVISIFKDCCTRKQQPKQRQVNDEMLAELMQL
jgi:hypothetical protein